MIHRVEIGDVGVVVPKRIHSRHLAQIRQVNQQSAWSLNRTNMWSCRSGEG